MELLHRAVLALIEAVPLDRITIDDIVAKAGIGRSTFYRHYATKEDLVDDIARHEIDELADRTFPLLTTRDSSAACLALVQFISGRRKLWAALLNGGAANVMQDALVNRSMVRGATQVDLPSLDFPVDLAAAYGVAATLAVVSWWLRQVDPVPIEKVAGYLDRFAVRPAIDRI